MAAPQVAAVGAMIRHLNPAIPIARVLTIIKQSARRPAGAGWSQELGRGILDAAAPPNAPPPLDLTPPTPTLSAPARPPRPTATPPLPARAAGPPRPGAS